MLSSQSHDFTLNSVLINQTGVNVNVRFRDEVIVSVSVRFMIKVRVRVTVGLGLVRVSRCASPCLTLMKMSQQSLGWD